MAQVEYIASTLTMGGALLAVAYLFVRTNSRRRYATAAPRTGRYPSGSGGDERSSLARIARTPATWYVGFVLGALLVAAAGVVSLGGTALSGSAGTVAALSLALLVALYLALGTYATAKSRGRPESLAVAEGIGVIGGLALLGIVVLLVVG